jgi:5-methylcytosine-specific restriction endonuclease McrA
MTMWAVFKDIPKGSHRSTRTNVFLLSERIDRVSKQADNDIGWHYCIQSFDDELAHIEDTLRSESLAVDIEHVVNGCVCPGKRCPDCGLTKCYGEFHRNRRAKTGLTVYCKVCDNARTKAYEEANPEKRRRQNASSHRKYYEANRENIIERNEAYRREHFERNRFWQKNYTERHPEVREAYRQANREKLSEQEKTWRQANPEKCATYFENRRTRKKQASGSFSSQEWKALKIHYDYTCLRCGRQEPEIRLTADHVVPLAKGGSNFIDNIQPLCRFCNTSKGVKIIDYRRERDA